MPEPLRLVRTPEEIFKARVEKKLVKKTIPEVTRQRIIELLRIRRGLLNSLELDALQRKVLDNKQEVLIHFTDISVLSEILNDEIKDSEYGIITRSELNPDFLGSQGTRVPELYATMTSTKTGLNKIRFPVELEYGIARTFVVKSESTKKDWLQNIFENLSKEIFSDISDLSFLKLLLNNKTTTLEELQFVLKHYRLFKSKKLDFLNDPKIVSKIHEIFSRAIARSQYFSLNRSKGPLSAMNIGLLFPENSWQTNRRTVGYDNVIKTGTKPIGFYISNESNLSELLHIMFSNAKSLDDIVPVYGNQGKLLWPV